MSMKMLSLPVAWSYLCAWQSIGCIFGCISCIDVILFSRFSIILRVIQEYMNSFSAQTSQSVSVVCNQDWWTMTCDYTGITDIKYWDSLKYSFTYIWKMFFSFSESLKLKELNSQGFGDFFKHHQNFIPDNYRRSDSLFYCEYLQSGHIFKYRFYFITKQFLMIIYY